MLVIYQIAYATNRLYYFCRCSNSMARSWALALLFFTGDRTFLDTVLANIRKIIVQRLLPMRYENRSFKRKDI